MVRAVVRTSGFRAEDKGVREFICLHCGCPWELLPVFLLFKFVILYEQFNCFSCERRTDWHRLYFNSCANYEDIDEKTALGSWRKGILLPVYFLCPAQNWVHMGCPANSKWMQRVCSVMGWVVVKALIPEFAVPCISFGSIGQPPKLKLVFNHRPRRVPNSDMRSGYGKT